MNILLLKTTVGSLLPGKSVQITENFKIKFYEFSTFLTAYHLIKSKKVVCCIRKMKRIKKICKAFINELKIYNKYIIDTKIKNMYIPWGQVLKCHLVKETPKLS